jgi:flavin reductase (DIM6/NTAB) family NADH-FMN oxidoreductase RutF
MATQLEQDVSAVMEELPYGLYIVGSQAEDGEPNGMLADWVMQVSFQPRLVAVAFEQDAHTLANIRATGAFTVNLLGQDHAGMHLAQRFAQPYFDTKITHRARRATARVHHKLDGIGYSRSAEGGPVLDGAIAWVACTAEQFVPVGDHTLVIGRVTAGAVRREAEPLTSEYTGWPYSG